MTDSFPQSNLGLSFFVSPLSVVANSMQLSRTIGWGGLGEAPLRGALQPFAVAATKDCQMSGWLRGCEEALLLKPQRLRLDNASSFMVD